VRLAATRGNRRTIARRPAGARLGPGSSPAGAMANPGCSGSRSRPRSHVQLMPRPRSQVTGRYGRRLPGPAHWAARRASPGSGQHGEHRALTHERCSTGSDFRADARGADERGVAQRRRGAAGRDRTADPLAGRTQRGRAGKLRRI